MDRKMHRGWQAGGFGVAVHCSESVLRVLCPPSLQRCVQVSNFVGRSDALGHITVSAVEEEVKGRKQVMVLIRAASGDQIVRVRPSSPSFHGLCFSHSTWPFPPSWNVLCLFPRPATTSHLLSITSRIAGGRFRTW
jgi:hypothetical protein